MKKFRILLFAIVCLISTIALFSLKSAFNAEKIEKNMIEKTNYNSFHNKLNHGSIAKIKKN